VRRMEDKKRFIRRLAKSFASCTADVKRYGACIRLHYEAVERHACENEFAALQRCFRASLTRERRP